MTVALLTAAGTGTRMGQDVPKQFLHVQDKPIIVWTMERFQRNPQIEAIVCVTLPHWIDFVWVYAKQFGISKLRWVVPGGETGQDSIRYGLDAVAMDMDPENVTILIHDGNRPMVDDNIIADALAVYKEHGNAVAAIPCVEVVFKDKVGASSLEQIPREELWRTQTPQVYNLKKLILAHEESKRRGFAKTAASSQLMALLGERTWFSKGSEKNLKLTTMDDMEIFKALLKTEKSGWEH